jgi:hypothetical protein
MWRVSEEYSNTQRILNISSLPESSLASTPAAACLTNLNVFKDCNYEKVQV